MCVDELSIAIDTYSKGPSAFLFIYLSCFQWLYLAVVNVRIVSRVDEIEIFALRCNLLVPHKNSSEKDSLTPIL